MVQHGRVDSCLLEVARCTPRPRGWGSAGQLGWVEESWKAQGAERGPVFAGLLGAW